MAWCRYSMFSKISKYCAMFFYPTVGLGLALIAMYLLECGMDDSQTVFSSATAILMSVCILSVVIAIYMFWLGVNCYAMESRKFSLSKDGLTFGHKKLIFYPWDQVCEVAVVAYGASASLESYQTVICCFLKPRTENFLKKILHSYIYGVRKQNDVVIIDYSPFIYNEFRCYFHGEIKDHLEEQGVLRRTL